jgi:ribonuclease HI
MVEIVIFADGGSLDNGSENQRGYGTMKVFFEGELKRTKPFEFGNATNNEAEYKTALEVFKYLSHIKADLDEKGREMPKTVIKMDSRNAVRAMNGNQKRQPAKNLVEMVNEGKQWMFENKDWAELVRVPRDQIEEVLGH